jgi:hypothetical protein
MILCYNGPMYLPSSWRQLSIVQNYRASPTLPRQLFDPAHRLLEAKLKSTAPPNASQSFSFQAWSLVKLLTKGISPNFIL